MIFQQSQIDTVEFKTYLSSDSYGQVTNFGTDGSSPSIMPVESESETKYEFKSVRYTIEESVWFSYVYIMIYKESDAKNSGYWRPNEESFAYQ